MKIMISFPPLSGKGCPMLGQNRQFQWFTNPSFIYPMVPASAATLLKINGFDVIWNDAIAEKLNFDEFVENFIKEKPDMVVFETKTPVVKQHWEIINKFKEIAPATKFILMGDHITALPYESFLNSKVDYCITGGHYDVSLLQLVKFIAGSGNPPNGLWMRDNNDIKNTGTFDMHVDLNKIPFIDRDLTKWYLYGELFYKRPSFTYTMVGRDCPWAKCAFCSWTTIYPKFNVRTPESLLDEIEILINKYKVREIFDDTGTFPSGAWLEKFCNGMITREFNKKILFSCNFRFDYLTAERARMMKKAGFRLMKLGFESANQNTLDKLDKGTKVEDIERGCKIAKNAGLEVHLTIMVGYPWETKKEAENTLNLAKKLMEKGFADMLQSTVVVPYPGTPLYKEAIEKNWFRFDPEKYERYDMAEPVFKTPDMNADEVMDICDNIYKIFLSPKFVLRHLLKIRSFEDIKYYLRGAKAVVGHIKDFMR